MKAVTFQQSFLRRLAPESRQVFDLFDLIPDVSFFVKDRSCRFVALNRRGCEYCGVRFERDAMGRTDRDFFAKPRADRYMADDRAVMKSGQPILNRIEPAPEMEGSPRIVVTNKVPLRDARGRVIGVAGFSRQIERLRARPAAIERLSRALDHLHERYAEPITTDQLAKLAGLSPSQFERVFRQALGAAPRQYLLRVRIEAACRLLVEENESMAMIAQACGFYDQAHFTRSFSRLMGLTPSAYRKAPARLVS